MQRATPLGEQGSGADLTTHMTSTFNLCAHTTLFPSGPLCGFNLRPVWLQSLHSDSQYHIRAREAPHLHASSLGIGRTTATMSLLLCPNREVCLVLGPGPLDTHALAVCRHRGLTTLMGTCQDVSEPEDVMIDHFLRPPPLLAPWSGSASALV